MTDDLLLEPLALRDLSPTQIRSALDGGADDGDHAYGMATAAGGARVEALVEAVEAVLGAGLPRHVAIWTLLGGCARLERDQHGEYSDTVVRETLTAELEPAFVAAGHAPVSDGEVNEIALLLAQAQLAGLRDGYLKGMAGT